MYNNVIYTGTSDDKTRMILKYINFSNIERGKSATLVIHLDLSN